MSTQHEPVNSAVNAIEKVLHETNAKLYDNWTKWIGTILSIAIIVIGWASFNAWERNEALARRVEEFLDKQSDRNERAYDRLTDDFSTRTERIEKESMDRIQLGLGTIESRQALNEASLSELKQDVRLKVDDALAGLTPSFALMMDTGMIASGAPIHIPRNESYCTPLFRVRNTGSGVARNVTLTLLLDSGFTRFEHSLQNTSDFSRDPKYTFRKGLSLKEDIRPDLELEGESVCFYPRDETRNGDYTVHGLFIINHDGAAVKIPVVFFIRVSRE